MSRFGRTSVLMLLALFLPLAAVRAQTEGPTPEPEPESEPQPIPRIHIVEAGENLTVIAQLYNVSVEELQILNHLDDSAILSVGQELIIPGGEGDAIATVYTVQLGDTLGSVAAAYNTERKRILETNRLIHPYYEPVAGRSLSVVSRTGSALPRPVMGSPSVAEQGESLLLLAARYNLSPALLAATNGLRFPAYLYPGQRLRIPDDTIYRDLPGAWVDIGIRPWPIVPGSSVSIYVENLLEGQPSGYFSGRPLNFVAQGKGFVALAGLDAFTEPGRVTLSLSGAGSRPWQPFQQDIQLESAEFGLQSISIPPELSPLLAPEIRRNEDAFLERIYTRFTETQLWEGLFQFPVTNTIVTAGYGDARSYNEGPVEGFHTGVDFGGPIGTSILAPANGVVVFNGDLQLRGKSVILDHGLGVMTAYFHLSESFVEVDSQVAVGQPIAAGGSSGLSTGPHLHWELRIMNVPVDGRQWTRENFP